jgi:hypothetical protein
MSPEGDALGIHYAVWSSPPFPPVMITPVPCNFMIFTFRQAILSTS